MSFNATFSRALAGVITATFAATMAGAQDFPIPKTSSHTLGSAADVWRIELRRPLEYRVLSSGDSDGTSELRKVAVRLEDVGYGQYHAFDESSPWLDRRANSTADDYVEVRVGNTVHLTRLTTRDRDGYNMWVHAKQRTNVRSRAEVISFKIKIRTRELDCARSNICNRGDNGETVYTIGVPVPTVRSNRCIDENTYEIRGTDGQDIQLVPKSESREINRPGTRRHDDGPHLALQTGEICIASTASAEAATPPRPSAPTTPEVFLMTNKASDRCLSLGAGDWTARSVPVVVRDCVPGNPEREASEQHWQLNPISGNIFSIKNSMQPKCLNLRSSVDNREGGPVKAVGCSSHPDQQWRRISRDGAEDKFQNVSSGKCLNVHGRERRDWGRVSVYSCANTQDQEWFATTPASAAEIARWRR